MYVERCLTFGLQLVLKIFVTLHVKRYHLALKIIFEFIVLVTNTTILACFEKVSLICELLLLIYSPPKSRDRALKLIIGEKCP